MPAKVRPGARVAVVSPSFAAPGAFPAVHERAMRRLREDLGLEPVEFPTTRRLGASPEDRAADLMAAFLDPDIEAVLATIGGDDQIAVLPHLDAACRSGLRSLPVAPEGETGLEGARPSESGRNGCDASVDQRTGRRRDGRPNVGPAPPGGYASRSPRGPAR